jgi:hypothetical protein
LVQWQREELKAEGWGILEMGENMEISENERMQSSYGGLDKTYQHLSR